MKHKKNYIDEELPSFSCCAAYSKPRIYHLNVQKQVVHELDHEELERRALCKKKKRSKGSDLQPGQADPT